MFKVIVEGRGQVQSLGKHLLRVEGLEPELCTGITSILVFMIKSTECS